ncbi:WD40/YVTN/BNR-like repeat-containing protein [Phytopseudomonas dryadis]|uniref:Photosynthesis system II assembly factor Ycf48/Hcf136-like domain-containing protein n=1 Tax=Phytopseudomonas dryadis TaxID=2487520 RepID=A0A4Q9QYR1_9GAMM|nr:MULTISPECIES: YCF48-related protein [Pseudomonas]TBU90624.1 hypothetical protein DNK44_15410 [Pseudomonas dryadis]TBV03847.1 hypothetical protein DNK34_15790 [Pseudomonas dryadis]TBV16050.1 hypothetical protein DNK41_16355 [Pseudomonas sp. FRB 230]
MSEPVTRRTRTGEGTHAVRKPALRLHSPLARALSLCGLLSLLALGVSPAQAQIPADEASVYSVPSAKAASSLLLDIASAGKRLVAVGDRGHILYSDDDGASWQQAKVPTRQMLTALFFLDEQHGWAVGHDAQILASSDGGLTWSKQFEDLQREAPLLDVWFEDLHNGYAVGAYGALLETRDGGATWEDFSDRLDNEDAYHLNAIAEVKDSGLFIVGEMGSMFRSTDAGQSWEPVQSPYQGSLFGVLATTEAHTLLVYGLRGHLFRSDDFGDTWQQVPLRTANGGTLEFGLANGTLLADGRIVVVGHGGSVLDSTDGGRSFSVSNRPDRISLAGVAADAQGRLILVGQGGVRVAASSGQQ